MAEIHRTIDEVDQSTRFPGPKVRELREKPRFDVNFEHMPVALSANLSNYSTLTTEHRKTTIRDLALLETDPRLDTAEVMIRLRDKARALALVIYREATMMGGDRELAAMAFEALVGPDPLAPSVGPELRPKPKRV